MQVQQQVSLKPYNTFGIDVAAAYFIELNDEAALNEIANDKQLPGQRYIIGGGSNILLNRRL